MAFMKDGGEKGRAGQGRSRGVRRAARIALIVLAIAVAAGACVYALWRSGWLERLSSVEELRALIAQTGIWAGLVYFLMQMMTVIVAPIPSNVTMMAGALALGFWPSLLLGIAAIWAGSMIMFLLSRRLGQRAVQGFIDRSVMEKYLPLIEEKQDMFLFLTLLFPFFPDDMLCILAGLTSIPTGRFAAIMLLARPWGLIFAALLGSGMLSLPPWGWAVLTLVLGAVFVLAMKYSRQIEDRLFALVSRLSRRREK